MRPPWAGAQPVDQRTFFQRFAAAHFTILPPEPPRIRGLSPGPHGGCPAASEGRGPSGSGRAGAR
eukprot:6977171-Alexandrium_andersonii.AAC.1